MMSERTDVQYQDSFGCEPLGIARVSDHPGMVTVGYALALILGGAYLGIPAMMIAALFGANDLASVASGGKKREPKKPIHLFSLSGGSDRAALPPAPPAIEVPALPGTTTQLRDFDQRLNEDAGDQKPDPQFFASPFTAGQPIGRQEPRPVAPVLSPARAESLGSAMDKINANPAAPVGPRLLKDTSNLEEPAPASLDPCLAREMTTPDSMGFYRSWGIFGESRTGKGAAVQAAIMRAKKDIEGVTFFAIDPKADPSEAHRWAGIPKENRLCFEAAHPLTKPSEVEKNISELVLRVYKATGPVILIVDELKVLMDMLGRISKSAQSSFSSVISGIASQGSSRHRLVWIASTALGVGANGLSSLDDLEAFNRAYLATPESFPTLTAHKVFGGLSKSAKTGTFEKSGRAFITSQSNTWEPLPLAYRAIDVELAEAAEQMPTAESIQPTLPPSDKECSDLATAITGILQSGNAIALTLPQLGERHSGIEKMLASAETTELLKAALNRAGELGLLRVFEVFGEMSVGAVAKNQKSVNE